MGKFKKILIGLIVGVMVLITAFVGTLIYLQSRSEKAAEAKKETKAATVVYKIENPIVCNIKDNMKINVRVIAEIELADATKEDKKFAEELKANDGIAINAINVVLRGKTVAEVSDPQAPTTIAKQVTEEIKKAYNTDKIIEVIFREFITQ